MNKITKHLIFIFLGLILLTLIMYNLNKPESASQELISFAKCLTENNVIMYGTEWRPHCKRQKEMFKSAIEHITFIDCDKSRDLCARAEVSSYPQWVKDNDLSSKLLGTQSLTNLAEFSGCTFR